MVITIKKSNFNLLVIQMYSTSIKLIEFSLKMKLEKAPYFINHKTPIIINVANINYCKNWFDIYQTILKFKLFIVGVCCCNSKNLKKEIINSGLVILNTNNLIHNKQFLDVKLPSYDKKSIQINSKTQLVNQPIRSGQQIYANCCDLIILNNVSSGAEIIADGSIYIHGSMKGRVLAGASGNKQSQIYCTNLTPELISIGGFYWLSEQIPKEFIGKSVKLRLKNDILLAEYI